MWMYQNIYNKIKKNSEEKVKAYTYATWYGNTLLVFAIALLIMDFCNFLSIALRSYIFEVLFIIIMLILCFYLGTRKAGIGLTENRLVYVKFKHIGYNESKVFEIPFEKIKSLSVRKIFNVAFVKVVFISDIGRLEKIKFTFNFRLLGLPKEEVMKNTKEIYEQLCKLQKVLDKGDF